MCADNLSKTERSLLMSRIRGKNTKPELIVRSLCHSLGLRFRLHKRELPGKPDLVFPKHKTCIFVHGCFWHRHKNCRYARIPKSNTDFWLTKMDNNVRRDIKNQADLMSMGWRVVIVWECECLNFSELSKKIVEIFGTQGSAKK
ncbi:very short patch repair endonuclease [Pseudomonas sp. NPDC086566]|uniref:very short patch repair endonuclease n=1 Tax=Pseudomonas sp. NPDC086566 TaxID=3390647 RepID=UPI003D0713A6